MANIERVRAAIEAAINAAGVELKGEARLFGREASENGVFDPMEGLPGGPRIIIRRAIWNVPGNALHEAMTLAHEFGHFRSFAAGRPLGYVAALHRFNQGAALRQEEKAFIIAEEILAWTFARSELAELEFEDWASFDQEESRALGVYRTLLGMSPSLPIE